MLERKRFELSLIILQLELNLDFLKKVEEDLKTQSNEIESQEILNVGADKLFYKKLTIRRSINHRNSIEFLVQSNPWRTLRIRIDNSRNHKRPHLHIDLDRELHVASISLDNTETLAGHLPSRVSKIIKAWIVENNDILQKIWNEVQSGNDPTALRDLIGDIEV